MNNFIFSIPTTAYFGKGQISVPGETIKAYGGGSIRENGCDFIPAVGGGSTLDACKATTSVSVSSPNPLLD